MKVAVLVDEQKLEVRDVALPPLLPHQVLVRTTGVGICGTDLHIYAGHANYNHDAAGRPVPLAVHPQVLGHEISGVVEEVGSAVRDVKAGEFIVLDQGLNCHSQMRQPVCEYCASGDSHQCLHYMEHGITGLAGGFAEYVPIASVNAVKVEGDLSRLHAALTEPLACVVHAAELADRSNARYTFGGERPIRNVLILGAGPSGLLFLQYLRNVRGFDGNIFVGDLNERKRKLAAEFGGTLLDSKGDEIVQEIADRTHGEKIHYLVEATGAGPIFHWLPAVLRKQATVVLYGHGHEGASMELLNYLQFLEPTLVSPIGASGGFDIDLRPLTYRNSMRYITSGKVKVEPLVTHTCALETLPQVFSEESRKPDFVKAVLQPVA